MAKIRPINDELQKIAIEQLNEVPERIPEDLEALRTWMKQQPHLRGRTDDQFLLAFLRGCKFSLEKAKAKLDKYYALRTKYPDFFRVTDVDDPRFREIWRLGAVLWLPKPLHETGQRLMIFRNGAFPPDKYNIVEIMRTAYAIQDISLFEDDHIVIHGGLAIIDLDNVTAGHFFQMTPGMMKKMATYGEEAIPFRPKGTHFVKAPSGFEAIFNVFKPMLSEKQQKRLHVHGNKFDTIYKDIPKKYLPVEYGGENGTIQEIIDYWDKKFDEYREFFKEESNFGTDEHLRPGKPIDFDQLFGTEGSFRKLNVD